MEYFNKIIDYLYSERGIILAILWMLYANWEGIREGRYWYYKYQNTRKNIVWVSDEHNHFSVQRTLVVIGFLIGTANWWFLAVAACMFPFFHDGAYYANRNKLNPHLYSKKWLAQSKTSTAILTRFFTPPVRIAGLIIAIILTIIFL